MAARKETTGIQIGLIIFVILTIVLSVTTFMFYKAEEDAVIATKNAREEKQQADEKRVEVQKRLDQLKLLVGKKADPADPVEDIMQEYEQDQDRFAETYPENGAEDPRAATYPHMLNYLSDANKNLLKNLEQHKLQIQQTNKDHAGKVDRLKADHKKTQQTLDAQAREIRDLRDGFANDRKGFESQLTGANDQVRETQNKILSIRDDAKKEATTLKGRLGAVTNQLGVTKDELVASREVNLEAPDGEVVWVNQANGTVYINLGYGDGLRRQTTFSVYEDNVTNALNAEPKGTIEVVRVDKEHMAVAKVTSDEFINPIIKGDRVISTVFHRGRPERFAIAGFVDIDGDGDSDLELLVSLIKRNGGVIDALIDDEGNRDGTLSPRTKFLVLGERPTDKDDAKILREYDRIITSAEKNGVKKMALKDLLDHMGYRGRERSVGLGRHANPDDFVPAGNQGSSPFRRRPSG